jgi:hypothetical protein
MLRLKRPLDRRLFDRDPRSARLSSATADGRYVYAIDAEYKIYVLPDDAAHLHPKILGNGQAARYAGEVVLSGGRVTELTNCSGTFQFHSTRELLETARLIVQLGLSIAPGAVLYHHFQRIARPRVLPFKTGEGEP